MAAPKGNTNRTGKTGIPYNTAVPRLKCSTCIVKDRCPMFNENATQCAFMKRIRKFKLDTLDDIRSLRKQIILDSLAQLTVHSMISESTGVSGQVDIQFRKLLLDQLALLEKDEFAQNGPKKEGTNILGELVKEIANAKNKPEEILK